MNHRPEKNSKIYVAGHAGMVGSAIVRTLKKRGFNQIITRTSSDLDLRDQKATTEFFKKNRPEYVYLAAGKVGGIKANNTHRAEFIYDNMMIVSNVIHTSYVYGVKKLLFLGSSCIYPKYATQPIKEEELLTGMLEPTNEPYAVAKIAGIKMCEAYRDQYDCQFISCMPTNLYGPGDSYDLENCHVLPALVRKIVEAKSFGKKEVEIWGTGSPKREFLHVDDLADACILLMEKYNDKSHINVGSGEEITIYELACLIKEIIGYSGAIKTDPEQPNGTPRKFLDSTKLQKMGWHPQYDLKQGITKLISKSLEKESWFIQANSYSET